MNTKEPITPDAIRDKVAQLQQEIINLCKKEVYHKEKIELTKDELKEAKADHKAEVENDKSIIEGHEKELKAISLLMKEKLAELKNYEPAPIEQPDAEPAEAEN